MDIRAFRQYSHLKEVPVKEGYKEPDEQFGNSVDIDRSQDEIMTTIFAPDPITGVPRSDLAIVMSKDAAPEVSQYIRDTLMRPRDSSSVDDGDFALDTVKGRYEAVTDYADRLKEIVNKYNNKSE